tara:strand:- start:707 stop:1096 length:390 start_codon:yes stop_codon:yes gene_type:complete
MIEEHTAAIVSAFVSRNAIAASDLPGLISMTAATLHGLGKPLEAPKEPQKPAVPVSRSVHHDFIVCLEDGKQLKSMKRYLGRKYGLTPEAYRRKWGLPFDYPMVSAAVSANRSETAKRSGLGKSVRRGT